MKEYLNNALFSIIMLFVLSLYCLTGFAANADGTSVQPVFPTPQSEVTEILPGQNTYPYTPTSTIYTATLCQKDDEIMIGYHVRSASYNAFNFSKDVHYNLFRTDYNNYKQNLMTSTGQVLIICKQAIMEFPK